MFTNIFLIASAAIVQPADLELTQAVEVVRRHHLETSEGRILFLNGELAPFVEQADQLNHEIQALAVQIASFEGLENQNAQRQVVSLGEELNQKMDKLLAMLPKLESALLIDEQFQQLDQILAKQEPLEPNEKALVIKISDLCLFLDGLHSGAQIY